jgi:imidazolonepropionase-like amidohydrolase
MGASVERNDSGGSATHLRVEWLIDGTGADPVADAAILIDGPTIAWAGPASALPPDRAVAGDSLDFPGATTLPGFVDAHAHFSLFADGRPYEAMAAETDELMALAGAKNAWVHLASGITTARDNGGRNRIVFDLREAIERGFVEGPRLLVSGRPITRTGGHFHWCNGTADGEEPIRETVRRLVAEGADHIKIMASGGGTAGTDPGRASYSSSELRAAVETAHGLSRPTTAHCRASESMSRSIESGVDCMEHGEFLDPDGEMRFDRELAGRLVDSGMYLSPTMAASGWDTILRLRHRRETAALTEEEERALAAAESETRTRVEHIGLLIEMGLGPRIVAGTDAGCFDFSFGHMDYSIELLVAAGMSVMEAIVASTRVSAIACGVGDLVGSVEAGKRADVLVVDGDPLSDLGALSRVRAVFKDGRRVSGLPSVGAGREAVRAAGSSDAAV